MVMDAPLKKPQAKPVPLPKWCLADLYDADQQPPLDDQMAAGLAAAKTLADKYKGRLQSLAGGRLANVINQYQAILERAGRLLCYAGLEFAADGRPHETAATLQQMREADSAIQAELVFVAFEITEFDDSHMQALLADPDLADWKPWLRLLAKNKPHQLAQDMETLLVEKRPVGRGAWIRLFDEMATELRFDIDGELVTESTVLDMMTSPDGATRKKAGLARSKTLAENARPMGLILNTIAKDKAIDDNWRRFPRPVSARNLDNDVEDEVVAALTGAITKAMPSLTHRYYAIKAKWMGVDKLNWWDRNAPLPGEDSRYFTWDEARGTIIQALGEFDGEFAEKADLFFARPWIDASPRAGKASGAFSHPGVPAVHPYILLNYYGRVRDVMTLAHELGHGIHQLLAAPRGYLLADTPLTLAETASSFAEMLVFNHLLNSCDGKQARRALLAGKIEDMLNTVVRQIGFHNFETRFHHARSKGELTLDAIGDIWLETQAQALGPAIRLDDSYRVLWGFIPHFVHVPFYVYSYAFGDGLVAALWQQYSKTKNEKRSDFIRHYKALLAAGGSKHHSEALAPFKLDAASPAFWSLTVDMIGGMIDRLEEELA